MATTRRAISDRASASIFFFSSSMACWAFTRISPALAAPSCVCLSRNSFADLRASSMILVASSCARRELVDDPRRLELRPPGACHALLLDGIKLGLHLLGVLEAGGYLLLALVEHREHRLECEPPEEEGDNGEVQYLRQEKGPAEAEFLGDLCDAACGLPVGGRIGRGTRGLG